MSEIIQILERHRKTYYNFATAELNPFWIPKIYQAGFAGFGALVFSPLSHELLQSTLTIYSILIGFSFSVLFHLISQRELPLPANDPAIEAALRKEKLSALHDELFHSVTYFVVSSLTLVSVVLIYYVALSLNDGLVRLIAKLANSAGIAVFVVWAFKAAFSFFLYFLILETGFVFARIVGRVTYYFQQKIKHDI